MAGGKSGWRVRDGAGKAVEEEAAEMPVRKEKGIGLPCWSTKGTGCHIQTVIVFLTVFPRRQAFGVNFSLSCGTGAEEAQRGLWTGLNFLHDFWRCVELGGRSTREDLPAGPAPLLTAQLAAHAGPSALEVSTPPCRMSSRRRHHQDALHP